MKKAAISLLLIFALCSNNAFAARESKNYRFMHDLIDCLSMLEVAAGYSIEDAEFESLLPNLYSQIPRLRDAKAFMKNWIRDRDSAIKATAMGMYVDISETEDAAKQLVNLLNRPMYEGVVKDVAQYASKQGESWDNIFQTSSLALWVIIKPARSKNPGGEVPFIISDRERKDLIKYLNKQFALKFRKYEELENQKKKGLIEDFNLTIPVWSALHLRALLTTETYEEAIKAGK